MSEHSWHGIPRPEIPWYPSINYEKCTVCGKCVDFCTLGTYAFEEKEGENRVVVKNPYKCVVLCKGCDEICPTAAIQHPDEKETRGIIKKLRKTYSLSNRSLI